MKKSSETEKTHTFFLKIGEEMMQKWMRFEVRHGVFEREKWGRQWTVTKIRGKNWKKKKLKNCLWNAKHTFFATDTSRQSVTRTPAKTLQAKRFENFAKCFSRLEVSLARELWAKPWKSLCTPRDWTFHSGTSHQNWLTSSRLWHATWMICDWVAKIG